MFKTFIIYETFEEPSKFFILNGDLSHLDGIIINATDSEYEDELLRHLFHPTTGKFLPTKYKREYWIKELRTTDPSNSTVIQCGFAP